MATPAAFAQTIRKSPPPIPMQSMITQGSATGGHAPVRIHVRPDAPIPQMSPMVERALGTTVRIGRREVAREAPPQAWRPFRGFIVGASLGAAIMMVFTASGSDRVRDVRAWVATSLRTMKSDGAARAATSNAASSMVVPVVVDVAATKREPPAPTVVPTPAPAACATPRAANAAPNANVIPSLDVMQLPKAKAVRPWKASRRATPAPRVDAPADDGEAPPRAGDDA